MEKLICQDCGVEVPSDLTACGKLFDAVLARDFSDYQYFQTHRLLVDAYSLQHPDQYMRSGKSFAAHLTGMCAAIESPGDAVVNRAVQQWLNGQKELTKPDQLPVFRGSITVLYVFEATDALDHNNRVKEWAADVWRAWDAHHDLARIWIEEALSKHSRQR